MVKDIKFYLDRIICDMFIDIRDVHGPYNSHIDDKYNNRMTGKSFKYQVYKYSGDQKHLRHSEHYYIKIKILVKQSWWSYGTLLEGVAKIQDPIITSRGSDGHVIIFDRNKTLGVDNTITLKLKDPDYEKELIELFDEVFIPKLKRSLRHFMYGKITVTLTDTSEKKCRSKIFKGNLPRKYVG